MKCPICKSKNLLKISKGIFNRTHALSCRCGFKTEYLTTKQLLVKYLNNKNLLTSSEKLLPRLKFNFMNNQTASSAIDFYDFRASIEEFRKDDDC